MKEFISGILTIAMITIGATQSFAASETWSGTTSNAWEANTNWGAASASPGALGTTSNGDVATFSVTSSSTSPTVDSTRNIASIAFSGAASAYTIGGSTLLLSNGGTIQTVSGLSNSQIVNAPLSIQEANGAYIFSSNAAAATLFFGGGITGGAAGNTVLTINGTNTGANSISGIIGNGTSTLGITKAGTGTWTLSGTNTYAGVTTLSAGTLNINNASALGTGALTFTSGTIDNTSGSAITLINNNTQSWNGDFIFTGTNNLNLGTGVVALGATRQVTVNGGNLTVGGAISGSFGLTKLGIGTLTLSNLNNPYNGTTSVNAGTLSIPNNVTIGGPLTLGVNGILSLGANTFTTGAVTTAVGSTINTTLNGTATTQYGNVAATGSNAIVPAGTIVNLTVNTFVPNATQFRIIDGGGAGGVDTPTINVINSTPSVTYAGNLTGSADLIITATRQTTSITTTPNATSVATAVASITNPGVDMVTALTQLDTLTSSAAVDAAYDEMLPDLSAGPTQMSFAAADLSAMAIQAHLANLASVAGADQTGISTGDTSGGEAIWVKGFATSTVQDRYEGVNGYEAVVGGGAGGYDVLQNNDWTIGVGGGYAYSNIEAKNEDNGTNVKSYQAVIYAGYADGGPWFFDSVFSLAWNQYDATRGITFGTLSRVAVADYDGQQYTGTASTGYTFKALNDFPFDVTPLASFQYSHLNIDGYTETEAGDLNLRVDSQAYNLAKLGLGTKISKAFIQDESWGTLVPEIHVKWLYDFIGDRVATTNTFTGGGGSFSTLGFEPVRASLNAGFGLTWYTEHSMTVDFLYDFELKEAYYSHNASLTLRLLF